MANVLVSQQDVVQGTVGCSSIIRQIFNSNWPVIDFGAMQEEITKNYWVLIFKSKPTKQIDSF